MKLNDRLKIISISIKASQKYYKERITRTGLSSDRGLLLKISRKREIRVQNSCMCNITYETYVFTTWDTRGNNE